MKVSPAQLFPLLRSDAQGMILAQLFMLNDELFAISDLAKFAGVSLPTAMREVDRLLDANLVTEKHFGRTRAIQANVDHELYPHLRKMISYTYGPAAVLPNALAKVDGLEHAYIYGSWAARLSRQKGPEPKDVDVLLVGYMSRIEAARAAATAERQLDREINVQFVSNSEWEKGESGFIKTVKSRPIFEIPLDSGR
ncbi:MAG: winged helix-turn-helix domain-containing protein [Micrococcales bacterium]